MSMFSKKTIVGASFLYSADNEVSALQLREGISREELLADYLQKLDEEVKQTGSTKSYYEELERLNERLDCLKNQPNFFFTTGTDAKDLIEQQMEKVQGRIDMQAMRGLLHRRICKKPQETNFKPKWAPYTDVFETFVRAHAEKEIYYMSDNETGGGEVQLIDWDKIWQDFCNDIDNGQITMEDGDIMDVELWQEVVRYQITRHAEGGLFWKRRYLKNLARDLKNRHAKQIGAEEYLKKHYVHETVKFQ